MAAGEGPAQFGDWPARRDPNEAYDRARPDVVATTLGADDVAFTSIVRFCVAGFADADAARVAAPAAAGDPLAAVTTALTERAELLARALEGADRGLVDDVASGDCWDVFPLSAPEQSYLQSLQDELQRVIVDAVGDLDGVPVVGLSRVIDGHEWCTEDPWALSAAVGAVVRAVPVGSGTGAGRLPGCAGTSDRAAAPP